MEHHSAEKPFENRETAARYNSARDLPEATRRLWIELITAAAEGSPSSILDVGCGTGRFTSILHEAFGGSITAIDPSSAMLDQAASTHGAIADWRRGTAEETGLESGAFDLVFMSQAYHHLQDVDRALEELRRVARSGSRFMIRNGSRENLEALQWLEFFPEALAIERRRAPRRHEIIGDLERTGYRLLSMRAVEQCSTDSWTHHLERVEQRALSVMVMIDDDAFREGCRRLKTWIEDSIPTTPVIEPVDFFVFSRDKESG